jgi:hypothetical protein
MQGVRYNKFYSNLMGKGSLSNKYICHGIVLFSRTIQKKFKGHH